MSGSPLDHVKLTLVDSLEDAQACLRWLGERREGPLGIDTESGGLSPWHNDLRLVQVGDLHQGWALPWPWWSGIVRDILRRWEGPWTLHNAPHDTKWLAKYAQWDIPWHRITDTMTLSGLDEPLRSRALKPLSEQLVDPRAAAGQERLHEGMAQYGWTWATVPYDFPPYWIYGALDPVLTCHLHDYLAPRVKASCPEALDLELGTLRIVTQMMQAGVLIDQDYVLQARPRLEERGAQLRAWLTEYYKVESPWAAGQLQRAFGTLHREPIAYTTSGMPQYTKEVLRGYRDMDDDASVRDLASSILELRHLDKIIGTYLNALVEGVDSAGRLHCTLNPMGARTHRMSASEPNLQNLPRDDRVVRGAIVPAPGNVLITCDLGQVEARLAAHFADDQGLIEAFNTADASGADFFSLIASGIYQEPIEKADRRRQLTKNVVYTSLFGGGLAKMAQQAGVSVEQMRPAKDGFDHTYPGLRWLIENTAAQGRRETPPSIRLESGRRLVADDARAYTQLCNARIQGTAAEYFKRCLLRAEALGLAQYLRLVIHDEIMLEAPKEDAQDILRAIQDAMTDETAYRVPIRAEGKIMSERWEK